MKNIINSLVLTCLILMFSCGQNNKKAKENYSTTDLIWLKFSKALEVKDYNYLIENSMDTIQCVDCFPKIKSSSEFYEAKFIFGNNENIKKIMHLESLSDKKFSTFVQDNLFRVNYIIENKTFLADKGYNLIFTFKKTKEGYLFFGMIVT